MKTRIDKHNSIEKLQPKLRFPEFEGEWKNEKLINKVNSISSGKIKPKEVGEFFVYGSTGIIGKSDIFSHEGDYILVARVGANAGQINRAKGKFSVTDNTLIIDLKDKDSVSFCELFLKKYNLNKLIFGSGQPLITGGLLKNIDFISPTLPEQTKIASFLTAVDDKLHALKQKHALLEQYKKGVMQKIFAQELRFKPSPIEALEIGDEYPDWVEKRLGEVLVKNSKKNKNQEFKLVQSVSNKRGFVNQDEYFEDRIIASKDLSNYYVIQKGDFAYNPSRIDVGSLAYKFDDSISVISPLYISFKANKDFLKDSFLLEWFTTQEFIKQMNSSFEGSVRNTLSYESLRKIEINFPCLPEQTKIASFLSAIDKKINQCQTQIAKTEVWKKGLLQQLFV